MRCQRCQSETTVSIGSMFNTEQICTDCGVEEREHPRYEEARRVESEHVRAGDYNYPGIGLPPELRRKAINRVVRRAAREIEEARKAEPRKGEIGAASRSANRLHSALKHLQTALDQLEDAAARPANAAGCLADGREDLLRRELEDLLARRGGCAEGIVEKIRHLRDVRAAYAGFAFEDEGGRIPSREAWRCLYQSERDAIRDVFSHHRRNGMSEETAREQTLIELGAWAEARGILRSQIVETCWVAERLLR